MEVAAQERSTAENKGKRRLPAMAPPTRDKKERQVEGHASRSSSRISSRRNSGVSTPCVSLERMDVDEEKKSKRVNEEKDEEKDDMSNLARMRAISPRMREFLYADDNAVNLNVCKNVLGCMCDMEDLLLEILLENERLSGIIEAVQVSGATGERKREASYASITTRHAGPTPGARVVPKVSASEKHAVVVRPVDAHMSSEKVKEKVLKDIQPNLKVRVNAVRMLRSGGIAIEAATEKAG